MSVEFTEDMGIVYALICKECNKEILTGEFFITCRACMLMFCEEPCYLNHLSKQEKRHRRFSMLHIIIDGNELIKSPKFLWSGGRTE